MNVVLGLTWQGLGPPLFQSPAQICSCPMCGQILWH